MGHADASYLPLAGELGVVCCEAANGTATPICLDSYVFCLRSHWILGPPRSGLYTRFSESDVHYPSGWWGWRWDTNEHCDVARAWDAERQRLFQQDHQGGCFTR